MHHITGLYIHVPFCDGKCFYCAFYSAPYQNDGRAGQPCPTEANGGTGCPVLPESKPINGDIVQRYLRALETELKLSPPLIPETIYFGGGTPSVLSLSELQELCRIVKTNVAIAALKEWTVEANPGSLTSAKLGILAQSGVNRISLGAQSFNDQVLKWLGRRHSSADIHAAVRMIKAAGFANFGIDLIACVPGFKPDVWLHTLQSALALNPTHISVYALTSEEGSRLAQAVGDWKVTLKHAAIVSCGRAQQPVAPFFPATDGQAVRPYPYAIPMSQISLLTEDEELEALNLAENILTRAGYHRYEISNYAQPSYECRHNLACWRGEEYIGLGPAAASHVGLKRRTNDPNLKAWLEALEHGQPPPCTRDLRTESLKQTEAVVFGLRMAEGISEATAKPCRNALLALREAGLLELVNGRWRLTARGINLADYVGAEILAGVD